MFSARILCLAAAGALTGCTAIPPGERDVAVERHLPLPAPVAAMVVAEAVRVALPFADPEPYCGGAPATEIDRDDYVVRYEARGSNWLPAAEHRLLPPTRDRGVRARPTSDLPGYGLGSDRTLQLEIRTTADGAAVRGALPGHLLPSFDSALLRGIAAEQRRSPCAIELLRAREFALAGELDRARHHRDHAVLAATDPTVRAHVMRQVTTPDSGPAARQQARERLSADDLATARVLLHTARRNAPKPGADYELLWRLHRQGDEGSAALASALLAREHDPLANSIAILELQQNGLADLVDRITAAAPEFSSIRDIRAASITTSPPDHRALPAAVPPR